MLTSYKAIGLCGSSVVCEHQFNAMEKYLDLSEAALRTPHLDTSGPFTWGDQSSSYAFLAVHALVLPPKF